MHVISHLIIITLLVLWYTHATDKETCDKEGKSPVEGHSNNYWYLWIQLLLSILYTSSFKSFQQPFYYPFYPLSLYTFIYFTDENFESKSNVPCPMLTNCWITYIQIQVCLTPMSTLHSLPLYIITHQHILCI